MADHVTSTLVSAAGTQPDGLRGSGFGRLWTSTGAANLGDGLLLAGLPVLATSITTAPTAVAGVTVAIMLPMVLSALPAGAIADRADRRRVLVGGNLVRVLTLGGLAGIAAATDLRLAIVYLAALAASSTEVLVDTTAQATVPGLVPDARLDGANARLMVTQRIGNDAIGAPIGAALAGVGAVALFAPSALLYAVATLAALRLRPDRGRRVASAGPAVPVLRALRGEVAEGLTYLRGHRILRRLAIAAALSNLGNTAFGAVAVLYVVGPLGLPASAFGFLLVAIAVGGLLGGLVAEALLRRIGVAAGIRAGFAGAVVAYLVIAVTVDVPVVAGASVALGACSMVINVAARTLRQRLVPGALLGRTTASMAAIALVATPVGAVLGGVIAELVGIRAAAGVAVGSNLLGLLLLAPLTAAAVAVARTERDRS